jgi:signal transduction histidine kinase
LRNFSSKFYLIAIIAFLFLLDGFVLLFAIRLDHDKTVERAKVVLQKTAISLDERVKRTYTASEAVLHNLAQRIQEKGISQIIASKEEWERFRNAAESLPDAGSLWLLDSKAELLMDSTMYPSRQMNFADREYYIPQRDNGIESYIGPLVKGRITEKYSFTISHRINGKDGQFLGIVLAAIETDDFTNFLRNLDIGEGSRVTVFRTDGALILRQSMQDDLLGKNFKHLALFSISSDKSPSGIFESPGIEGIKRFIAYRKIEGLPLIVTTGIPVDSVLKEWHNRVKYYVLIASIVFLLLVWLAWQAQRSISREDLARRELLLARDEISKSNEELELRVAERTRQLEAARAEAAEGKRLLELVLEALPVGMAITDIKGGNIRANRAFELIWGGPSPPTDSIKDYAVYRAWWVDTGEPVQPEEWASARAVLKGEVVQGQMLEIERFDGTHAFVINSASPIVDAKGKIVGSAVAIQDITDLKRAGEALKERTAQLEAANRELEAFIYSVSHDLRQPLRAIASFSQMVRKSLNEGLADKEKGYLKRVIDNTVRMSDIIESMLKLSRISRQEIKLAQIDMTRMAEEIVSGIREAHPERCTDVAIGAGLTAVADPGLMATVLDNLIGNAWKFTAGAENACIEFGVMDRDKQNIYFVKDNGAGFDPEYAKTMFRPFHRLHPEIEFDGMGIGLSIVERVIARHGGAVWAEGAIGKGATVFFTLPAPHKTQ